MAVETVYRSCPTCEASCGLALEVDRATRQVLSIKGDDRDQRSRGYVCAKSQAFHYVHEDPQRLRRPVKKVAGGWQEVGWEEALNDVAARLGAIRNEHGKDAIAMYYGNPNGHNFHSQIYTQLLIQMLDTERFFSAGSVDQQPKNLGCELLYGNAWLFPIPDIDRSDFFVCMGGNPLVSQGSLMSAPDIGRRLAAIRARHGQVVVLDPRRSETALAADRHLFIKPGTDAFLLLAWVHWLFAENRVRLGHLAPFTDGVESLRTISKDFTPEATAAITGVPAAALRQLAGEFADAKTPVLYGRTGLCTQRFGTIASWLIDVVNALNGRLDAVGGAMFPLPATGHTEPPAAAQPLHRGRFRSRARGFPEYLGMLPASLMAEELECDGRDRVRAMITLAGNPVLTVPNGKRIRATLQKIEFMVALDFYVNETTACADYILPSTTQLEHSNYDFMFTTTCVRNFARYSPQVFQPEPDSREQWQIFTDIVARMNGMTLESLTDLMRDGLIAQVLASPALPQGLDAAKITALTGAHPHTEQLLDIMLRAGPYGDRFGLNPAGIDLDRLKAAPHGIDLGPLQPQRLPAALATPGKRLALAPQLILDDVRQRLLPALQEARDDSTLLLIGRRHVRDMNSWLHNLHQYARGKPRCTLLMHPQDARSRGIADGDEALIRSRVGEFRVPVALTGDIMPGVVSLPHGFGHRYRDGGQTTAETLIPGVSANDLVDDGELDLASGTSVVNGVPVEVRAVPAPSA